MPSKVRSCRSLVFRIGSLELSRLVRVERDWCRCGLWCRLFLRLCAGAEPEGLLCFDLNRSTADCSANLKQMLYLSAFGGTTPFEAGCRLFIQLVRSHLLL